MGEVKPWHEREQGALAELEHRVAATYPTLHVVVENGLVHVRGTFPVLHDLLELDRFEVDVVLARNHPRELPAVYETGGRIPRTPERHVNSDGTACVGIPDVYWLENPTGEVDVLGFLRREVHNYFLGQAAVENGDPWPFGEWSHGREGLLEHYGALFGSTDPLTICRLLRYSVQRLKGHLPCPCGSSRRYRNCHREVVSRIAEHLPMSVVLDTITVLLAGAQRSVTMTGRP
jgi:hypothetical protein